MKRTLPSGAPPNRSICPLSCGRTDRIASRRRLALDEVVGQLIERPVEIVVGAHVALEGSDQDFPVQAMILVERKAGALADQDASLPFGEKNESATLLVSLST